MGRRGWRAAARGACAAPPRACRRAARGGEVGRRRRRGQPRHHGEARRGGAVAPDGAAVRRLQRAPAAPRRTAEAPAGLPDAPQLARRVPHQQQALRGALPLLAQDPGGGARGAREPLRAPVHREDPALAGPGAGQVPDHADGQALDGLRARGLRLLGGLLHAGHGVPGRLRAAAGSGGRGALLLRVGLARPGGRERGRGVGDHRHQPGRLRPGDRDARWRDSSRPRLGHQRAR
ncbi:unnamed protein product, partial [Prorocentrum cordatum]